MNDEEFVRNRPPSYGEFAERPFPGSPDDMMNTIAALRARVAKLEAALEAAKVDHDALVKAVEWVGQVHPDNADYGSSRLNIGDDHAIHMTWGEWNNLRAALGLSAQRPFPKRARAALKDAPR